MRGSNRESCRSDFEPDDAAKVDSRLQYLLIAVNPLLIWLRKLEVILVGNGQAIRCLPDGRESAGGLLRMCCSEKGLLGECSGGMRYAVAAGGGKRARDRRWWQIGHDSMECCTLQASRCWMLALQYMIRWDMNCRSPFTLVEAIIAKLERLHSRAVSSSPDMAFQIWSQAKLRHVSVWEDRECVA